MKPVIGVAVVRSDRTVSCAECGPESNDGLTISNVSMCKAIFQWQGLEPVSVPVFRIHGRKDLVIPPPPKVDLLLDGGHLVSMSHARECIDFISNAKESTHGAKK